MSTLIYSAITSLDGYVADTQGNFDWAEPDEEVHAFINDLERPIGTYLYGRRMFDTMLYWETADALPDQPAVAQDFTQIWQAADKIVYSRTLEAGTAAYPRMSASISSCWTNAISATAWCTSTNEFPVSLTGCQLSQEQQDVTSRAREVRHSLTAQRGVQRCREHAEYGGSFRPGR